MADPPEEQGITAIAVSGFKSLYDECRIEIRPLTVLAGANSSGKSSIMQPLLMMKQTLDAPHDPGPLRIDEPNVHFTSAKQFLCKDENGAFRDFIIAVELDDEFTLTNIYRQPASTRRRQLELVESVYGDLTIRPGMTHEEILQRMPQQLDELRNQISKDAQVNLEWRVVRNRCFYTFELYGESDELGTGLGFRTSPSEIVMSHIRHVIHVPALRGNPQRTYPASPVRGPEFVGRFDVYVAGVISRWRANESSQLRELGKMLEDLGLTWKVTSRRVEDTQVELRVGRLKHSARGGAHDLVNIADVGFGVSQVLPVLVALLVAQPQQLVYIEQPEIHLHPRAQVALAKIIADAANRGVRVVVETHSVLLIQGIQTLIAQEELAHDDVILHWFTRDDEGKTTIHSQEPDSFGAYGDWPEDFAEVQMQADSDYLDAVEQRKLGLFNGRQEPETSGD
ncbi:MAG: DUF3696 domain-containing protein [Chloroflexi bacterium]|nr:MAG: DUF3696 domain-containing protein [Chloroflexota bacterium]